MKKVTQFFSEEYVNQTLQSSVEDRLKFLEDYKKLLGDSSHESLLISIRIARPLLESFKLKAKAEGKKYQTLIKELMQAHL